MIHLSRITRNGSQDDGFTIIELMITLLILGILVGIVMLAMSVSRNRAREAACKANIRTIHSAIMDYHVNNNGNYPDADNIDELFDFLVPTYIKFRVSCPSDNTYSYDKATGTVTCSQSSHNP